MQSRIFSFAALFLFIAATVLFFFRIGQHSFWGDELQTAGLTFHLSHADLWMPEHPETMDEPFSRGFLAPYYSIAKIWTSVFGRDEAGFRSLSAVSALVALAMILLWGPRIWGLSFRTTFLAGSLFALSPMMLWYAQEARYYALLQPITLMLCTVYLLYGRTFQRRWMGLWAFIAVFAVMTHPFMIFIVGAMSLYGLWRWNRGTFGSLRTFLVTQGIAFLGFAMLLPSLFIANARVYVNEPHSLKTDELMPWRVMANFLCGAWNHPSALIALLLVVSATIALTLRVRDFAKNVRKSSAEEALLWVVVAIGGCFLMIIVSTFRPIMVEGKKYGMIFFAPFCVSLALALTASRPRLLPFLFLGVLGLNAFMVDLDYYTRPQKQNWRLAGMFIRENSQSGDVWLHHSPRRRFAAEYYGGPGRATRDVIWPTARLGESIPDDLREARRVWIVKTGSISDAYARRLGEIGFRLKLDQALPSGPGFATRLWRLDRVEP